MTHAGHGQREPSDAELRELFACNDLRCTRQRQVVYATLAAAAGHPTADELYAAVRRRDPGISLATVYNTLETLTRRGLCRRLAVPGSAAGAARYDAVMDEHAHVVGADGSLADVPADLSRRMLDRLHDPELVAELESRLGVRVGRIAIHVEAASAGEPEGGDQSAGGCGRPEGCACRPGSG